MNTKLDPSDYQMYSDLYKDVNGFRPKNFVLDSVDDYKMKMKELGEQLEIQMERELVIENQNLEAFNKEISNTMGICNCSWKRAIELLMDAEECCGYSENEMDYFLYGWGLNSSMSYEIIKHYKEEK